MGVKDYLRRITLAVLNEPACKFSMERDYIIKQNEKRFGDKIAIVTGASGAIGGAIATRLVLEGATVYACGRNQGKLEQFAEKFWRGGYTHCSLMLRSMIL